VGRRQLGLGQADFLGSFCLPCATVGPAESA